MTSEYVYMNANIPPTPPQDNMHEVAEQTQVTRTWKRKKVKTKYTKAHGQIGVVVQLLGGEEGVRAMGLTPNKNWGAKELRIEFPNFLSLVGTASCKDV